MPKISRRHVSYGLSAQADVRAEAVRQKAGVMTFNICGSYKSLKEPLEVRLKLPGVHNVANVLAAAAVTLELNVSVEDIKAGIESFSGVERRFEIKGSVGNVMVVDDYGHHPVEIKAVLKAAKQGWERRAVVVFQPHRYSRTIEQFEEFITSFNDADVLVITEIYAAGERPVKGVSGKGLYEAIKEHGHKDVTYVRDIDEVTAHLEKIIKPGDLVMTLGAGDVWRVGEALIDALKRKYPEEGLRVVDGE